MLISGGADLYAITGDAAYVKSYWGFSDPDLEEGRGRVPGQGYQQEGQVPQQGTWASLEEGEIMMRSNDVTTYCSVRIYTNHLEFQLCRAV